MAPQIVEVPGSIADKTPVDNKAKNDTKKSTSLGEEEIQVDGKIYSAKKLSDMHPGGKLFVKVFAGRDATEAFLSYHRREFPHDRLAESLVGTAVPTKKANVDAEFLELCRIVEQVLPRNKAFAPMTYYIKAAVILGSAVGLELYIHAYGEYRWYLTGFLGFLMALIGLNIQHDANHGAISRNPTVNRLLGMSQNWIGGSAVDWIHQHVVQHHTETNDVHHDPDIVGSDLLRLNPLKPMLSHQLFQHIYVFGLIAFFGMNIVFESLNNIIKGEHHAPMSKMVKYNRVFEASASLFFGFRWLVFPLMQQKSLVAAGLTFLNIFPLFMVGGYYLAFFFIISHNFLGVHMFDKSSETCTESFLYKQVASSSNVGGSFLCFINGGLNYQIEHHLFPRISHTHYPTIAPIVREFCLARKIPYRHFPTILENFTSCVAHLAKMAQADSTMAEFHR